MNLINAVSEFGYEQAALGFSLSYNTTIERAKQIMPKYAWGTVPGENKFLRIISVWIDCRLPRFMWQEADQYKVATTTLSESTVHTLKKRLLTDKDFCTSDGMSDIAPPMIDVLNMCIIASRSKQISLQTLKANLPEGFLQRRIWHMNYATVQNIITQRRNHPVKLWGQFIDELLPLLAHPEFVVKS